MVRTTIAATLLTAVTALAGTVTTPTPLGSGNFCTVNPGLNRSSVVCDYAAGFSPRHGRDVRVRVLLYLKGRGQLSCAVTDVYDPEIPSIRDGRILRTETRCY